MLPMPHLALARLPPRRTGRMSTPARSRVSGAAGDHEGSSSSRRNAPGQYDLGGAQAVARSIFRVDCCPVRHGSVRGARAEVPPGLQRGRSRRAYVEANAAALRALLPAISCSPTTCYGRAVGAASGAPFRVKAHGSELDTRCRGRPSWASGRGKLLRARTRPSWLRAHSEVLAERGWPH